jgi:hypothetical protein
MIVVHEWPNLPYLVHLNLQGCNRLDQAAPEGTYDTTSKGRCSPLVLGVSLR